MQAVGCVHMPDPPKHLGHQGSGDLPWPATPCLLSHTTVGGGGTKCCLHNWTLPTASSLH